MIERPTTRWNEGGLLALTSFEEDSVATAVAEKTHADEEDVAVTISMNHRLQQVVIRRTADTIAEARTAHEEVVEEVYQSLLKLDSLHSSGSDVEATSDLYTDKDGVLRMLVAEGDRTPRPKEVTK